MFYRRLLTFSVLAAALVPASLSAGTLLDISGPGPGSGNYTGVNAHNFYGVTFTAGSAFSNVSASAQLEGNYMSSMSFATYLYDTTTSSQVISGSVAFTGTFPTASYDLFNGNTFSLTSGDSYAVLIAGSGYNAIWDGTNTPTVTNDPGITYNGSVYASAAGASGYSSYSGNMLLNLSDNPAGAPEPGSAVLLLPAAAAVLWRRRRA